MLPPEASFCPTCGTPVSPGGSTAERRVITVLFADLAGFTTMADGRDPEAVKVLLDECFDALVPVVESHGGTVDKIIGDELMAVFGTPTAHEDDPARAVHAALGLADTLAALRPELVLRIGVNTGEVLVGRVGPSGAPTVTGDTVNTAHRLVDAAQPREILVGERTREASRASVRYEDRGPYQLRGKRDEVHAYAAMGRLNTAGRPPEVRLSTRLVGRDDELARLLDLADESAQTPAVRFVQIRAEGGIGKTRLASEMHRRVVRRRSTRVLWGRGRPYGTRDPWQPLGDALRPVFGLEHLEDLDAAADHLRQRVTELIAPDREPNRIGLNRLAELLGIAEPSSVVSAKAPVRNRRHDEQVAVARTLLEALARDRPLVIVIDDAHAVDDVLLEFLAGLHGPVALPILVVLATREDLSDREVLAGVPLVEVPLGPLDRPSSLELIRVVLGSLHHHDLDEVVLGPAVEDRILEAVGGIPFLIEQVVQYLIERKLLVSAEQRWEVAADFPAVGLPDTARAMIDARVDALTPDERHLLQNASVLGRVFWVDAAAALAGITELETVEGIVESLIERELLGELVADAAGDTSFRHAIVCDAIYTSLPIAERAEKHHLIAEFLADLARETRAVSIDQLAHHSERAVMLHRELGAPIEDGQIADAYRRVIAAAEAARHRDAEREAERWYSRAEAIETSSLAERAADVLAHVELLIELRRFERAADLIADLLQHEAALDLAEVAAAHTHLGVCLRLAGDETHAAEAFDRARTLWRSDGDVVGEAVSLSQAGWAELVAGRPRSAQPKLLHAHDLESRSGKASPITLRSLGWCEFLLGNIAEAREHLWDAAAQFDQNDDIAGVGWCFGIMGFSLWLEGRVQQAHEIATTLLKATAETSDPWSEGMLLTLLGACLVEQGDVDAAADPILRAQRVFGEIDDPWGSATVAVVAGMSARSQGRYDEARRTLLAGIELTRSSTSVGEEARLLAELASIELDDEHPEVAVELARSSLDLIRSGAGDRDSEIRSLVALGRERRLAGELDAALRFLEEAIDLGDPDLPTSAWRRASSHLAVVLAAAGDLEASRRAADRALDGSYESVRTWTLAVQGDAAARAAAGDHTGAAQELRAVLARLESSAAGVPRAGSPRPHPGRRARRRRRLIEPGGSMCPPSRPRPSLVDVSPSSSPLEEALERAMEAFVYAPIGLVFEGPDPYPELVEKGRSQVTAAKMMGEFAVQIGQSEACKRIEQGRAQLLETLGTTARPDSPPAKARRTSAPANAATAKAEPGHDGPRTRNAAEKVATATAGPKPDLAIPDYDGLSASQVVTRLGGLSPDELEAVRVHELGHRGRKTILNKVAQIQG